jgi:hypothetical protein
MKKAVLMGFVLTVTLAAFGQQSPRPPFDLFGGNIWPPSGSTLSITSEGMAIRIIGRIGAKGSGYLLESNSLGLSGKRRIILSITGIGGNDSFDAFKLLKLEINDRPLTATMPGMVNRNDPTYINAREGEVIFDISGIRQISKINFIFFNCTVSSPGVKIEMFVE